MKKLLARLVRQSPAMIVAMLALFVALTGTAVATTSALITGAQIKNNSITGADVKNRSLRPIDFRGSVRGPRGLRGLTGATGTTGATGPQGPPGTPDTTNFYTKADSDGRFLQQTAVSGQVLRGSLSARYVPHTPNPFFLVAGSYPVPLPTSVTGAPVLEYVAGGATTTTCPGIGQAATPNRLCVYGYNTSNLRTSPAPVSLSGSSAGLNRLYGFSLDVFTQTNTDPAFIIASWAYQVP